jgi:phosphoesterase RecJ-like protein
MQTKLSADQIQQVKQLISNANSIVVTSHKSPDGDAVGSALAMYIFLKSLGKNAHAILPDGVPDFLQWLPGYNEITIHSSSSVKAKELIASADLIFSLDYNILSRVGNEMQIDLENAKADFILIDHHQQPGSFAKVVFSDTSACSTCEIVYHFIADCYGKDKIDTKIAEAIYCGIMTDSGSFRFPTVSKGTHEIVGEMIHSGLDHAKVHRAVYDTNRLERLRLVGYALSEKLEVDFDTNTAFVWLDKAELSRFDHQQGDTESLVNQALSIKGVKLAAFFREQDNEVKISFRSKGSFDVNKFAREHWSGGGHINAAGASSNLSMSETLEKFRGLIAIYKDQIKIS